MSNPQHSAAAVERLAKEVESIHWKGGSSVDDRWRKVARFILDREAPLLAALERIDNTGRFHCSDAEFVDKALRCAREALAAHRAATTPQEPSEREALRKALEDAVAVPTPAGSVERVVSAIEALVAVKVNAR